MSEKTYMRLLAMNLWYRENLPHGKFYISDLDGIIHDVNNHKIALVETKLNKSFIDEWQKKMFLLIDRALKIGFKSMGIDYEGFFLITANMKFKDEIYKYIMNDLSKKLKELHSNIELDNFRIGKINEKTKSIDEWDLIKILSLGRK